jgi:hypothetical protein
MCHFQQRTAGWDGGAVLTPAGIATSNAGDSAARRRVSAIAKIEHHKLRQEIGKALIRYHTGYASFYAFGSVRSPLMFRNPAVAQILRSGRMDRVAARGQLRYVLNTAACLKVL